MGLAATRDGFFPVSHRVFSENTADVSTVATVKDKLRFGSIPRCVGSSPPGHATATASVSQWMSSLAYAR